MTKELLTISDYLPIDWKRICSIGNRGHHNFGDELILVGLMRLLKKQGWNSKKQKLYVSGWDLEFLKKFHRYFFELEELQSVNYIQEIPHGIRSLLRFLTFWLFDFLTYFRCDVFIIWGGELFTEETPGSYLYWFWSLLPYWIRKIFVWTTKLYVMGGVQQPKKRYNQIILKYIIGRSDWCFLRDGESVEVVKKIKELAKGKKDNWVEWFMDTSYFAIEETRSKKQETRIENWLKHIIINTSPLAQKWTEQLRDIVWQYYDKWYTIYFLSAFFTSNPEQDDMSCFVKLQKEFPFLQLLDRRDRDTFLIIFKSAEKVYCSRLHIFLIATFLNLKVQPYAYQKKLEKIQALLDKLGLN